MAKFLKEIICGDCVQTLQDWEDDTVDMVFADPPFNIGYNGYDSYQDRLSDDAYLDWSRRWIEQCLRVLRPTGTLWIAIGDEYVSELDTIVKRQLPQAQPGWWKRSHVVWYYTFGVLCQSNFARSHTHLLYYASVRNRSKRTFNADDPQLRHPSARQLIYNDKRANPAGRLPDNTWIYNPLDYDQMFTAGEDTWFVNRIAGTHGDRADRGQYGQQRGVPQMPPEVMRRVVRSTTKPGDFVVDPFLGTGATIEAAVSLGRYGTGIDLSEACCKMARQRIEAAELEFTEGERSCPKEKPKKTAKSSSSAKRSTKRSPRKRQRS